jgi:hypothetical protein
MARLRKPAELSPEAAPAGLLLAGWNSPNRKELKAERLRILAKLTVKPRGVADLEWIAAHGFQYANMTRDQASSIGLDASRYPQRRGSGNPPNVW